MRAAPTLRKVEAMADKSASALVAAMPR